MEMENTLEIHYFLSSMLVFVIWISALPFPSWSQAALWGFIYGSPSSTLSMVFSIAVRTINVDDVLTSISACLVRLIVSLMLLIRVVSLPGSPTAFTMPLIISAFSTASFMSLIPIFYKYLRVL
uniref:Uncharacterized protein n=1 Tax=Glossina austeni TaxID=7395 RepID=A0A1A9UQN1_GLOAU